MIRVQQTDLEKLQTINREESTLVFTWEEIGCDVDKVRHLTDGDRRLSSAFVYQERCAKKAEKG